MNRPFLLASPWTLLLILLLLPPVSARAEQGYQVQQFHPSPTHHIGYLSAQSGLLMGQGAWSSGVYLNFAQDPFVVSDLDAVTPAYAPINGRVVTSQTTLHLLGAYGVFDWLEVGADIPLVVQQEGDRLTGLSSPREIDSTAGLGDLRLIPKAKLFDTGVLVVPHRVSLAMAWDTSLPTGDRKRFQGGGFAVEPLLVAEWQTPVGLRLVGNLGYAWRAEETDVLGVEVGDTLTWSVAAEMSVVEIVDVTAEVFQDVSREALLGVKYDIAGVHIVAAVAAGLGREQTTPEWRVFTGAMFHMGEEDRALHDHQEHVPAVAPIAEPLGVKPGSRVDAVERIALAESDPVEPEAVESALGTEPDSTSIEAAPADTRSVASDREDMQP